MIEVRLDADEPMGAITNGGPPGNDSFHVSFDPTMDDIAVVIVDTVATIKNTDQERLDPLVEAVDPEALNRIAFEADVGTREITFTYSGFHGTVDPDGDLWLDWE